MAFQNLPGFRDFYPADCAAREELFRTWREVSDQFGFAQYDGPPLEPLDLYTTKSGQEIVGQLYNFTDKGEREISLRPEMTPTLARMAGARQRDFKKPIKWYAIPQLFRYERQQRGRLREHFQWNGDILGEPSLGAEAELLSLLTSAMVRLELGPQDIVIRLSDRHFWLDFLDNHNVPQSRHYEFFQTLDKIERTPPEVTREKLGDLAPKVEEVFESTPQSARFDDLMSRLDALGLMPFVEIDLRIVRGLAYYTGVVFEMHDRKRELRAIAGGGRYDSLLQQLSGNDMPAVGFGMGDVVILELLKARNLIEPYRPRLDFFVAVADEDQRAIALALVGFLRSVGYRVDYALSSMKFNKQLELAEDRGAHHALIVGNRAAEGTLEARHLKTRETREIDFTRMGSAFNFNPSLPSNEDS